MSLTFSGTFENSVKSYLNWQTQLLNCNCLRFFFCVASLERTYDVRLISVWMKCTYDDDEYNLTTTRNTKWCLCCFPAMNRKIPKNKYMSCFNKISVEFFYKLHVRRHVLLLLRLFLVFLLSFFIRNLFQFSSSDAWNNSSEKCVYCVVVNERVSI